MEEIVLDPIVTADWADFRAPSLTDADRERLAADEFLPWFDEGRAIGLVAWTMRTHDEDFVGVSGLFISDPPAGTGDPEFGAMLAARWHRQGLATEAGMAILDDGWSRLGLARMITVMDAPNPASRRLVDKLGFRFDEIVLSDAGRPHVRFVLDRPPTPSPG
jgi:RimJ/RimL family protein N-acetyltransferase